METHSKVVDTTQSVVLRNPITMLLTEQDFLAFEENGYLVLRKNVSDDAIEALKQRVIDLMDEYSLLHREPENGALSECERNGAAFVPYFPLANGLLTGKYLPNEPFPKGSRADTGFGPKVFKETNLALAKRLGEFAKAQGHTLLELAFSWLLSRPVVASVVAGAVSTQQMLLNASAFSWRLTDADLTEVDRILLIQQEQAN